MHFNIKSLKIKLLDSHDNESQQGFKQSSIRKDTKLINIVWFLNWQHSCSESYTFSNILETEAAAAFTRVQWEARTRRVTYFSWR